jgi:replicative DNA helicase
MMDNLQLHLMSASNFIGKSNLDLEEIVLATLTNYPESYFKVAGQLSIREFSETRTKYIYLAIKELSEVSVIDLATITDKLIQKKYTDVVYKDMNGFDLIVYLNDICNRVDSDAHLEQHVTILHGYAKRRELSLLAEEITVACNDMVDPQEVVNKINSKIVDIQEMGDVVEFDLLQANKDVYASLEPKKDGDVFIQSYITVVDKFIFCFESTELIIIAAAPSMGKTSFALALFKNWILNDIVCAFFSLEMGTTQLLNRMYAVESDINLSKMRSRLLSTDERKSLDRTIGVFEDKKFYIDDRGRKLSHICNKIRKFVIRHKVKVIIIDYLQLMSCDIGTTGNRQEEVATITRTLKELAMELRIPILALSQINRAIHSRSNKRPTLGDLRESGAIEQDADMVVFVHRPAYFRIEETLPEVEYTELIFAKGRSTGIGTVEVAFQSSKAKFINNSYEEMKSLKVQQMGDIPNSSDDTPF